MNSYHCSEVMIILATNDVKLLAWNFETVGAGQTFDSGCSWSAYQECSDTMTANITT